MDAYREVLRCSSRNRHATHGINRINRELIEHRVAISSTRAASALIMFADDADALAASTSAFAEEVAKTDSVQHLLRWTISRAPRSHITGGSKGIRRMYRIAVGVVAGLGLWVHIWGTHHHVGLGVAIAVIAAIGALVWVRGIWLALTLTRAPKQLLQSKLDGLEREFFGVFDCDPPSNVLVDSVNYVFAGLVVVVGGAILVGLGLLSTQLI